VKAWILLMLALSLPFSAVAQEEAKEGAAPKVSYVTLSPPFVGNYGLDGGPKLKVFKADVALRVTGDEAAKTIKANEPLIRNQLVALFSQQTTETLNNVEAKEKLRQEALKQVQQVLTDETGHPVAEDLLFNNLIVQ
jgi:flagellar protein FliL